MTLITKHENCGNSPKNRTLLELTIAFARADVPRLGRLLVDDVVWTPAGKKAISGRDKVIEGMLRHGPASELELKHVVSHGKHGAVDGVIVFGRKRIAFCFMYEFSSARGTAVSAYTSFTQALR
jgi:hypothetical protein